MKKFGQRVLGAIAIANIAYWGMLASAGVEHSIAWKHVQDQGAPTRVREFKNQPIYGVAHNAASFYNAACVLAGTPDAADSAQQCTAILQLMHEAAQQRRCAYRTSDYGYNWGELAGYHKLLDILCQEITTAVQSGDRECAKQITQDALTFAASLKQLRATAGHAALVDSVEQLRSCTDRLGLTDDFTRQWHQLAADIREDQIDALQEERVVADSYLESDKACTFLCFTEESRLGLAQKQNRYLKFADEMLQATQAKDPFRLKRTARDVENSNVPRNLAYWPKLWERSEGLVARLGGKA